MIPPLLRRHAWWILLAAAVAFLLWSNAARIKRIEYVTEVGRDPSSVPASASRQLIIPEHIANSYEWIAETQEMARDGHWRVRHTASENAPYGREVHVASPYRWWLLSVAWFHHTATATPWLQSIERAALYADPALHLLLLLATTLFAARYFGPRAGVLAIAGVTLLYPFAAGFLPGVPDDFALLLALTPWGLLPLLLGLQLSLRSDGSGAGRISRWFCLGGVVTGLGLWLSVSIYVPILVGLLIGGVLVAVKSRSRETVQTSAFPAVAWRWWGLGAAATTLVGYLVEYFPSQLGEWELRAIHPLYGIACLGAAEFLHQLTLWMRGIARGFTVRPVALLALGTLAFLSPPLVMWRNGNMGFFNFDLLAFRLTKQTEGVLAPNLLEWIARDQLSLAVASTLSCLALLIAAAVWAWRSKPQEPGTLLAFVLGPALVGVLLAGFHLRWWQSLGGLWLVASFAAAALATTRTRQIVLAACVGVPLCLGAISLFPQRELSKANVLSLPEVEGLVERDLAQSLAKRLEDPQRAIVLAPPSVTTTLHYYGGLRGLSSLSWENKAGLSVALRVAISTSREEAHALVLNRGITHLVLPSWDRFFETYTSSASVQSGELFYDSLRRWVVPLWLRPIPHQLPAIAGFENQSLTIFEVVDEQEAPVAMSRTAEYFIEMGQLEAAKAAGESLRRYPADFSALIARAQVEIALNDARAFPQTLQTIEQRLAARADRTLPWDRRISLAVVLARGKRMDLARPQVERCLQQVDEAKLRSLTTYGVFHFLFLVKALGLELPHPQLRELGLQLVPAESRARL